MNTPPLNDHDWDTHLAQITLRNDLTRALMEKNTSCTIENRYQKEIEATVSTYPPDLLRKISNYVDPAAHPNNPNFGINTIRLMIIDGATPERLNEGIHYLPLLSNTTPRVAERMLSALHLYPQLLQSDDRNREDHTIIAQRTALLHITYSMFHIYNLDDADLELDTLINSDWTLTDQKLVDLALAHPERGEAIRYFIIERKHVDTDLIEAMLANPAPTLNDGIL
jgi:hypothetical protein